MLPIALLPAAGILLRLGQPDLLGGIKTPVIGPFFEAMSAAGGAVFANLPLLFAIGVAIGFAKKADGSTALAAAAGYLVIEAVFKAMSPVVLNGVLDQAGEQAQINYSVFAGIRSVWSPRCCSTSTTPSRCRYLGFFGGRRFVPIVVSVTSLVLGFGSVLLPDLQRGPDRRRPFHRRFRGVSAPSPTASPTACSSRSACTTS